MNNTSNGWLKELMLDYGLNRLGVDQRSDISNAISSLYLAGVFSYFDLHVLNDYIAGYNAPEIAQIYNTTTDIIEQTLTRMLTAISTVSGYTDERFINTIANQYTSVRKARLIEFLSKHGQRFFIHDL